MDTGSFTVHTEDILKILQMLKKRSDMSNFELDRPLTNRKN